MTSLSSPRVGENPGGETQSPKHFFCEERFLLGHVSKLNDIGATFH